MNHLVADITTFVIIHSFKIAKYGYSKINTSLKTNYVIKD